MKEVSLKSNIILSLLYQILILITPFVTAPYISRVLGADGIGIYSYTNSLQIYFSMFATLGTLTYGSREIARVRDSCKKRSVLFWEIELLTVFTTMISLIAWFLFLCVQKQYKLYYMILAVNILAVAFDISWFYAGIERFKYIVFQNLLFKIIGIIMIFLCVKGKESLPEYISIVVSSAILSNLSMWFYLPRYIQQVNWKELNIFHHFKETLIYFVPTIATSFYTILDKTLIGLITGDSFESGYYEQATKIINMAKSVSFTAINNVLGSRMSYLYADGKYDEIKKRTNQSLSYIIFMGIGVLFGIIGTAPRLIPWFFGDGYEPVISLLKILSPIIIIIGISNCIGSHYYTPIGLRKLSAKFLIVGSFVNLCLNCILIPRYKSRGAAFASIVAELTISVLYFLYCDGFITIKQLVSNSWKRLIAGILMFLIISFINVSIQNNTLAVVSEIVFGFLSYILILFYLKDDVVVQTFYTITKKIKHILSKGTDIW